MATLKITGVDEEVVEFVVNRARSLHFKGQAEYLRNLIREDMLRAESNRQARLDEIVGPLHRHAEEQGLTEAQLSEAVRPARKGVARKRSRPSAAA